MLVFLPKYGVPTKTLVVVSTESLKSKRFELYWRLIFFDFFTSFSFYSCHSETNQFSNYGSVIMLLTKPVYCQMIHNRQYFCFRESFLIIFMTSKKLFSFYFSEFLYFACVCCFFVFLRLNLVFKKCNWFHKGH